MSANPSSSSKLALHGGTPVISRPFRRYNPIGEEEIGAVTDVLRSGVLSQFIGAWHPDFYGGPKVKEFEAAAKRFFNVEHAITVNSWTSGLIAAVGAAGIEPGDEVIVTPWTMSASATAILMWNAIPVFADIEPDMFCLDPRSVEANISPHTRAIMSVDIFGQSADMGALMKIARRHGLKVISDTAQAPGAKNGERFTGALGDIGGYSLNYHKHIHTGEGGIVVCDDAELAERVRLIRNHAEAVVGSKGTPDISNMLGYNFRLGEIESAIGLEQLRKLPAQVASRQRAAQKLSEGLAGLAGLQTPRVREDCSHVYYVYPLILDPQALGVSRSTIKQALEAEGVNGLGAGYQNLHRMPMYERRTAYGTRGFPWTSDICRRHVDYGKGVCPTAEKLHDETFLSVALCMFEYGDAEVEQLVAAFRKVWMNLDSLRG